MVQTQELVRSFIKFWKTNSVILLPKGCQLICERLPATHACASVCVHTHAHVHTQTHTHTDMHIDTRARVRTRTLTHSHAHTHTRTHAHTHTRTHAHTHTRTHTLVLTDMVHLAGPDVSAPGPRSVLSDRVGDFGDRTSAHDRRGWLHLSGPQCRWQCLLQGATSGQRWVLRVKVKYYGWELNTSGGVEWLLTFRGKYTKSEGCIYSIWQLHTPGQG